MENRHDQMQEQYDNFITKHPLVYQLFLKFTFQRIHQGFQNAAAKSIIERIRWETDQAVVGPDDFKINNNHAPFLARQFMREYPQYRGFFRTRIQISKGTEVVTLPELKPSDFDSKPKEYKW